jgi:hypothetical protein
VQEQAHVETAGMACMGMKGMAMVEEHMMASNHKAWQTDTLENQAAQRPSLHQRMLLPAFQVAMYWLGCATVGTQKSGRLWEGNQLMPWGDLRPEGSVSHFRRKNGTEDICIPFDEPKPAASNR